MLQFFQRIFLLTVVTLIYLTDSYKSQIQPTRNVSIQLEDLKSGQINVYFVCPHVRSKDEILRYYKVDRGMKGVIEKKKAYGYILRIKSESDLGTYECSVVTKDQGTRNATLNILDARTSESPTKFVYDVSQTKYIIQKSGSVELDCGGKIDQQVTWYKPAQYHIHTGNMLKIQEISMYDYGTYYCVIGPTAKSVLSVTKVILLPEEPKQKDQTIDQDVTYFETVIPKSREVRYRPGSVVSSADTVTWEQPPGTILLEHGRDYYMQNYSIKATESPFYFRVNRNGEYLVNKVGKIFISDWKDREVELSVEGVVAFGSDFKVKCIPSPTFGNNTNVIWRLNDKIVHRGNTFVIKNFTAGIFGKYSCEIQQNGVQIRTRNIDLSPEKDTQSKIEMTPDPGSYYSYHSGKKKELHCELLRENDGYKVKAKDVIWTFKGKRMDIGNPDSEFANKKRFGRLDKMSVSILVIADLDKESEGTYKCFQGNTAFAATLLMELSDILVELAPELQTAADNVNQVAEFHCRIDTAGYNSSFIKWTFKPENSENEEKLPAEARVEKPPITSSTSFVTIDNVLKRHDGVYICRVKDRMVMGRLIVKSKLALTVNPKEITVKPGGTARFLCQLTGIDGKVIWRRQDKKSFVVNKENRIGGSTSSLLEVKQVTTEDDGTIYECNFNKLTEFVTLWVKDDCALSQRKCKNETCIDESKFCDGKNDCGDNSDEDPKRCNECNPNSIHCDFLNNSNPLKRCVIKHWKCDGTDDCGNNFDELYCPVKNKDKCLGTHFLCGNETLIPRAYWCDGEADCPSMEDEEGCSPPQVIEPARLTQLSIVENTTLRIQCQLTGRPIPTITWRYNWGFFPDKLEYNITDEVSNCSMVTSTLTIKNMAPEQSGIYTCEGIAKRRVMAPDFSISVTKGSICKRPYFNNDAWYQESCIKCYCSNVTDDCTSATGYVTNPDLIESKAKSSDAAIMQYKTNAYFEPARPISFANESSKMYYINKNDYVKLVPDNDHFFGGSFNMRGSWINRYGYPLTYKVYVSGESVGHIYGPIVALMGYNEKKIYYCFPKYRLPVYASNETFENNIRIILWEQDRWFSDDLCTKSVQRSDFIDLLQEVRLILFRIKYFEKQTDFKMSKITMQEAILSKSEHSWVSKVEKCNCPEGYSGLSCEIKKM